jgi:hypothetical protein
VIYHVTSKLVSVAGRDPSSQVNSFHGPLRVVLLEQVPHNFAVKFSVHLFFFADVYVGLTVFSNLLSMRLVHLVEYLLQGLGLSVVHLVYTLCSQTLSFTNR